MGTIDLSPPNIQGNAWKYIKDCLDTGWVGYAGKYVDALEAAVCEYTGAKYAVATMNGTAALEIALRVAGVGPGSEVVVPTLTFVASVAAIRHVGAVPVFIDCDEYMQMDAGKLEQLLCGSRSNIRAVMPVHLFGDMCNMDRINRSAYRHGISVVEDACEALGSRYAGNRHAGTMGQLGCFSFSPNKIITTGGGGVIVTDDKEIADYAKYLTTTAKDDAVHYIHNEVGYNYRMSNIHAALGLSQMELLDEFIAVKKRNYELYRELLEPVKGVTLLEYSKLVTPNYWLYSIQLDGIDRDELLKYLNECGIQARPLWYLNHWQEPYMYCPIFSITEAPRFWETVLNVPSGSNLTEYEVTQVVDAIARFVNAKNR
jgi:dTDP-4-amino-4,6-dideoxygalactose transaminase